MFICDIIYNAVMARFFFKEVYGLMWYKDPTQLCIHVYINIHTFKQKHIKNSKICCICIDTVL